MLHPKLKRGQKVRLKNQKDGDKKIATVIVGPPVIIGDPQNPRGVFPIELKNYVIVSWGNYNTIERVSDVAIIDRRRTK